MPMPQRAEKRGAFNARRVCIDAAMLCAALALSYLEALLPIGAVIPLPGVKPGLANLVVMLAFFALSPLDAAMISFGRIFVSALLFGSPLSFFFSLCGGALSFLAVFLASHPLHRGRMSFIGGSVLSAAAHGAGQIAAAAVFYGAAALQYLPVLLVSGAIFGSIGGVILNLIYGKVERMGLKG